MNKPTVKKTTIETVKTVVIAVLVTAIVAFISGIVYANKQQATVNNAVSKIRADLTAQAEVKK